MSDALPPHPLRGLLTGLAEAYGLRVWRSDRGGMSTDPSSPLPPLCSLVLSTPAGRERCDVCYQRAGEQLAVAHRPWLALTCHAGLELLVAALSGDDGEASCLVVGREPVGEHFPETVRTLAASLGLDSDRSTMAISASRPFPGQRWDRLCAHLEALAQWEGDAHRARAEATAMRMDLATLAQVGVRLGNVLPAGKFLEELLQMAMEMVESRAAMILLAEEGSGELRPSARRGSERELELLADAQAYTRGANVAFASGEPLMRTSREFAGGGVADQGTGFLPPCMFWVPMKSAGDVVGVLSLSCSEPRSNRESMLQFTLLQLLATYGAVAVKSDLMRRDLLRKERLATMLLDATIRAQEEERERICLEIHDGVAQTMVAALRHMEVAGSQLDEASQGASALVRRSTELLRQSLREVRETLANLRPLTLDTLGLVATLREELVLLERETGWQTELKAPALRLSKELEMALYRIIHEAITNARKHSETSRLSVRLSVQKRQLVAVVRDWGKGFQQSDLPQRGAGGHSIGLLSMRKRAELLGGRCDVVSQPGVGTEVRLQLPLLRRGQSNGANNPADS